MTTVTLQEAHARLPDPIHQLAPGEELVITENDQPVARLFGPPVAPNREPRRLGTMKGTVLSMEHFDEPLEDFQEYMECGVCSTLTPWSGRRRDLRPIWGQPHLAMRASVFVGVPASAGPNSQTG